MKGTVIKKKNSYYCVFRVLDPKTGLRKQKWIPAGKTKRIADMKLNEIIGDIHNGAYRDIKKILFKDFAERWLKDYSSIKTKPSTYESYKSIIYKHLIPKFSGFFLNDITAAALQSYVADRLKNVKPKTVNNEIVVIKLIFKYANLEGHIRINPAVHLVKPRVPHKEMDYYNPKEIDILLKHCDPSFKPVFLMAIYTGMRRGEILGLQWRDIDWKSAQIHVKKSLWKKTFQSPKTKHSIRKIDMSYELVAALKKHRIACPPSKLDLVFPNSDGNPMDADNLINRHYKPAIRRAGIRYIRFHDLRHTNAALRISKNQNPKYITRQIGHASIKTTFDIYGHLFEETNQDEAKKLDIALEQ